MNLLGKTEYVDEFLVPETGKIFSEAYITKTDVSPLVKNLSILGGGSVDHLNPIETYLDLRQLARDSYPHQNLILRILF
jgi:hypothetical protein